MTEDGSSNKLGMITKISYELIDIVLIKALRSYINVVLKF